MKERKYVKLRVDMYEDTKFKIIDMKPERDLIHYIWSRIIALAGKVNLEGELYLSKSMPYTVETLAIEFNRDAFQVKSALSILVELEMVELTEDNVYRVKNFAKHQNIKVKEKNKIQDKEKVIENEEVKLEQNLEYEIYDNKDVENKNQEESSNNNLLCQNENLNINNIVNEKIIKGKQDKLDIKLDNKKNKKSDKGKNKSINKSKEISITDEEVDDISIVPFIYGDIDRPLGASESLINQWCF